MSQQRKAKRRKQKPDEIILARLTGDEWAELRRLGKEDELLSVADSGRADLVLTYLAALGIRDLEVDDPEVDLGAGGGADPVGQ